MSKKPPEMTGSAGLFRDQKLILELFKEKSSVSAFEPAVGRLFGRNSARSNPVIIGTRWFTQAGFKTDFVAFIPEEWKEELTKIQQVWTGCEKWWAGYPLVASVELRKGSAEGTTGQLRLNAEVGPIADRQARKRMIIAISESASISDHIRIRFAENATRPGQLYSRFFRDSCVDIRDRSETDELQRDIVRLFCSFEPEFTAVTRALREL